MGYEFSNRRGSEGIKIYKDDIGNPINKLYDANDRHNPDRVSSYIYDAGKGLFKEEFPKELKGYISSSHLNKHVKFENVSNSYSISLAVKKNFDIRKSKYPVVKLEDMIDLGHVIAKKGQTITQKTANLSGNIPVIAGGKTSPYNHNKYNTEYPCITISASGANAGYIWYHNSPIWASDCTVIFARDKNIISSRYLYELLKLNERDIQSRSSGNAQPHVYLNDLLGFPIPLPPLDIQNDMVKRIEVIDKEIENIDYTVNAIDSLTQLKNIHESPVLTIENIADLTRGPFGGSLKKEIFVSDGYKVYEQQHPIKGDLSLGHYYISKEKFNEMTRFQIRKNDIIVSCSGTIGKSIMIPNHFTEGIINQALLKVSPKINKIIPEFLKYSIDLLQFTSHGTGINNIVSVKALQKIKIPVPPLERQKEIVAEIQKQEAIIEQNKQKIKDLKEEKIAIINEIWED